MFEQRVPREAGACVVVRGVRLVMLEACLSKVLKHVREEDGVCCQIDVVVIPEIFAFESSPDLFRVDVVLIRDA